MVIIIAIMVTVVFAWRNTQTDKYDKKVSLMLITHIMACELGCVVTEARGPSGGGGLDSTMQAVIIGGAVGGAVIIILVVVVVFTRRDKHNSTGDKGICILVWALSCNKDDNSI